MLKEKRVISINLLKKLDNENLFVGLTNDTLFKAVMRRNPDILEMFLIDLMNLDISENDSLVFLDKELIKGNIKEKGKVLDINVRFGNKYLINIEVNGRRYISVKRRNDLYIEKIDTLRLEVNDKYHKDFDAEYLYQLNLNASEKEDKDKGISKMMEYDVINNIVSSDRLVKYSAYLAYYYNLYYNGGEEMSFSKVFMAALMSKSFVELYNMLNNVLPKEKLDKFMRCVIEMTNDDLIFNIHEWEKEKMEKIVEEDTIFYAKKEGMEAGFKEGRAEGRAEGRIEGRVEGREEGRAEGLKEGIESKTIEMIQNMLKENYKYESISKISGKTIEEIKKIEQSMKED